MTPVRAKRILRALGWRYVDLQYELNGVARTSYKSGDVWKWFNGVRDVPLSAAIFLRMRVRVAILERRLQRQGRLPEMNESTVIAIEQLRVLAGALECGAANLVDVEFGDYGDSARLAVDYQLVRAPDR